MELDMSSGFDEGFDQGMNPRRKGRAFRLEQRGNKERVVGKFNDPDIS